MNAIEIKKLITLFEGWLDGSIEIPHKEFGICKNTSVILNCYSYEYAHHFKTWDKYAGSLAYPIPSTNKQYTPVKQYYKPKKWSGKQGELRRDLLRHLINCLKNDLEKLKNV